MDTTTAAPITRSTIVHALTDAGVPVVRFQHVNGTTRVYFKYTTDDRFETTAAVLTALAGTPHDIVRLSDNYGEITVTWPRPSHMDRVVFELESQIGQVVTVVVPSSIHYSGRRTGRVVAIARMSGDTARVPYLVLDAECEHVLIPADAILQWEPQS